MLYKLFKFLADKFEPPKPVEKTEEEIREAEIKRQKYGFSTDADFRKDASVQWESTLKNNFQRTAQEFLYVEQTVAQDGAKKTEAITSVKSATDQALGYAMDATNAIPLKQLYQQGFGNTSLSVVNWFSSQGFIGWQVCAIIAQQWIVDRACSVPGKDAIRNGYRVTVNDGTKIDPKILDYIKNRDKKFKLNHELKKFNKFTRVFGIRILLYVMDVKDPAEYYGAPYNPDGVKPGMYQGMTQIDPYWITPMLTLDNAARPGSLDFYEPTYWQINGIRYHKSHLVISRYSDVADVLKPTYIYGGLPLTQLIYERVYGAERTANEVPQLVQTKRMNVYHMDLTKYAANQGKVQAQLELINALRDNYGLRVIGIDETMEQLDTTLTDLPEAVASQYELVAATANIPITELLGTTPKGFNATGEHDMKKYHGMLSTIQADEFEPIVDGHHERLIRSEVCPKFKIAPFETTVEWNPINEETAKEKAETNLTKANTGQVLINSGAISADEERARIIAESDSDYSGLDEHRDLDEEQEGFEDDPEGGETAN